ncbi:MAG: DUF3168 domain-containing protein [Acidimicrobiia bacterium]|nr:MAG: DUF3168 domain-containing protein [Acidimicrobiia bacterium]
MTVDLAPDAERLVATWLRDQDAVAAIFDDRVYTEIPTSPVWPLARLVRIGGNPTDRLARLDSPLLQIDVWGGPKATAYAGIATILAHLASGLVGTHDLGTVTAVEVGGPSWLPDDTYQPARPRYSADVRLWVHP